MSEFRVQVVQLGAIAKHPNADTLSCTDVDGYPVIFRTGDYAEGGKAVYVPVDAIVPHDDPRWDFLDGHWRIKAKRLRGVFSMGVLTHADQSWEIGADVQELLRIEKHDPDTSQEVVRGPSIPSPYDDHDPGLCPVYDIEGLRKNRTLFEPGELVWISEKIHGQNARFVHDGERLHVGSRTRFKKPDAPVTWNQVAVHYDLAAKLAAHPGIAIYGETYGNNADMPYGVVRPEIDRLVLFDVLNTKTRRWFDVDEFLSFAAELSLPVVPTLYRGPWSPELASLAEGRTAMPGASHVREGIVIKPLMERQNVWVGRAFLKLAGEGYLTRKTA